MMTRDVYEFVIGIIKSHFQATKYKDYQVPRSEKIPEIPLLVLQDFRVALSHFLWAGTLIPPTLMEWSVQRVKIESGKRASGFAVMSTSCSFG